MFGKREDDFLIRLRRSYAAQLKRKDEEIERLKRENALLMRTALKQSDNTAKWMEYAKRIEKKINKKEQPKP